MYVCVRVLDHLEMELEMSAAMWLMGIEPGPLVEQPVLLISESSLQPICLFLLEEGLW